MPPQFLAFRTGTPEDAPAIKALVRAAYGKWVPVIGREPLPMQADYRSALEEFRFDLLIVDDEIVGVLQTIERADHLYIENLAIHPQHQNRGHGKALLVLAEQLARHSGHDQLRLLTNGAFLANIALYESVGYAIDRSEPFMGGTTVYMSKALAVPTIRTVHGWGELSTPSAPAALAPSRGHESDPAMVPG